MWKDGSGRRGDGDVVWNNTLAQREIDMGMGMLIMRL